MVSKAQRAVEVVQARFDHLNQLNIQAIPDEDGQYVQLIIQSDCTPADGEKMRTMLKDEFTKAGSPAQPKEASPPHPTTAAQPTSSDFLADVLRDFNAPPSFKDVRVRCKRCGAVRTIPAATYREAVSNLALGYNCECGTFTSMVRKEDDVTFVPSGRAANTPTPHAGTGNMQPQGSPMGRMRENRERGRKKWWEFWK